MGGRIIWGKMRIYMVKVGGCQAGFTDETGRNPTWLPAPARPREPLRVGAGVGLPATILGFISRRLRIGAAGAERFLGFCPNKPIGGAVGAADKDALSVVATLVMVMVVVDGGPATLRSSAVSD